MDPHGRSDGPPQQQPALPPTAPTAAPPVAAAIAAPHAAAVPRDSVGEAAPAGVPRPPPDPTEQPTPVLAPRRDRPCILLTRHAEETFKRARADYFVKKRLAQPSPRFNEGYDDRDGHYIVLIGELIFDRFTVEKILGKGSFGTVVRAHDSKRNERVALKITRAGTNFRNQAMQEIDIVVRLNVLPALSDLVARILKVFEWKGHLIMSFELYAVNLYHLLHLTNFNGVSLDLTRKFAWQILQVLQGLQNHDPPIIHCDLKPENVLLRTEQRSAIRVIDFGSACMENRRLYRYIQSRFYRAPEVILNLEYGTAIDRWSLGVMLVEMHVGTPLFDGKTEAQQLQRFEGVLGPLPTAMVSRAVRASTKAAGFFVDTLLPDGAPTPMGEPPRRWELKLKPEAAHFKSIATVLGVTTGGPGCRRRGQQGHEVAVYESFLDFVSRLIRYDPSERLSVADALNHPFVASLASTYPAATGGSTAAPASASAAAAPSTQPP